MPGIDPAYRSQVPARRLARLLADRQWGVVARRQLVAAGLSASLVDRLVADGTLTVIHRGVYAVGHTALRVEAHWMAAVLACGGGSVLSHRSGGALWSLGHVRGAFVEVTAPGGRRQRPGIVCHEHRLSPADVTIHRGVPVTTVARTLLDLAGVLPREALHRVVEQAIRLGRYDRAELDATMRRARGRRELKPLRACLDELDPQGARTRSELERRALAAIAGAGLPAPVLNGDVDGYEVDLHWPTARLVVELDGRAWHSDPRAFEADRRRDADLQAAGWRVVRFTWRQVVAERGWFVTRIADLLAGTLA